MIRLIHEEARRELLEGIDYYTQISPTLGAQFYLEMERLMKEICRYPHTFRQFDPPARRHFAERFPYGVVYMVEADHVWIVAVMHLHRIPGYWRERLG